MASDATKDELSDAMDAMIEEVRLKRARAAVVVYIEKGDLLRQEVSKVFETPLRNSGKYSKLELNLVPPK